jgi:glycosyltransferase involved in cell wall biosynthesis
MNEVYLIIFDGDMLNQKIDKLNLINNIMKKKNKKTILILVVFFVLIIGIVLLIKYTRIFKTTITSDDIPDVKWPFLNLKDENNKNINMLCIRGYLDDDDSKKEFLQYINKGIKFIGCSSNQSFPRKCDNTYGSCHLDKNIKINDKYIEDYVLGWCHCFREPDKYIRGNIPRILISESDFNSENLKIKHLEKKYDYIAVQPKDNDECTIGWTSYYKNWPLAEKCIKILSDDLNLKGLIIGRDGCPINVEKKENIESVKVLPYGDFIDKIRESRFMLLPNLEDASPRVLTESLCINTPVFVNENILGGWKYVNNDTGIFFNENNIKEQAKIMLKNINDNKYNPRDYYLNNYGLKNSGKQLRDFLKSIYPELTDCKYVRFNKS